VLSLWSFQGARRPAARLTENDHAEARSLKTQQRARAIADKRLLARDITYVEVDVISRRTESSDEDLERSASTSRALAKRVPAHELGACRSKSLLHP